MVATLVKPSERAQQSDGRLLAAAVERAAGFWGLTNDTLGGILGLSPATVSRLRHGKWEFEAGSKPFELAQYLVRLFRSLDSMMGSDDAAARSWLTTRNVELDARPLDLMASIRGLMRVCDYVDAYRAKV